MEQRLTIIQDACEVAGDPKAMTLGFMQLLDLTQPWAPAGLSNLVWGICIEGPPIKFVKPFCFWGKAGGVGQCQSWRVWIFPNKKMHAYLIFLSSVFPILLLSKAHEKQSHKQSVAPEPHTACQVS